MSWSAEQIDQVEKVAFSLQPDGYDRGQVDLLLTTVRVAMRAGAQIPDPAVLVLTPVLDGTGYSRREVDAALATLGQWRREAGGSPAPGDDTAATPPAAAAAPRPLRWTSEQMDWVREARFEPVRRRGYDEMEVDAFLDEVLVAMGHGRPLPDIEAARFSPTRRHGYDMQEVDAFLDELLRIRPAEG